MKRVEKESLERRAGKDWSVWMSRDFSPFFPDREFSHYRDFCGVSGDVLKCSSRRRVVSFVRERGQESSRFVLKVYSNPHLCGILTIAGSSLAEREYRSLERCEEIGLPVAQPVAFGELRTRPGFVRSCFLITRFCEGAVDLRRWFRDPQHERDLDRVLGNLGTLLRRAHNKSYFLFSPNLRNILLSDESMQPEGAGLVLIDLPSAAEIRTVRRARRAQARDIGTVFGPLLRRQNPPDFEAFYRTYLPDPVAPSDGKLRRRVQRAALAHNNWTFLSSLRNRVHRAWKGVTRDCASIFRSGRLDRTVHKFRNVLAAVPLLYCLVSTRWEWEYDPGIWSIATILCLAGALVRSWGRCHCHYARRRKKALAMTGPYACSRNPMYVGNILVIAGAGVASELEWFLPVLLLWMFVVYGLAIRHEESRLQDKYGRAYLDYRDRVSRWFSPARFSLGHVTAPGFLGVAIYQVVCALLLLFPFILKEVNPLDIWSWRS